MDLDEPVLESVAVERSASGSGPTRTLSTTVAVTRSVDDDAQQAGPYDYDDEEDGPASTGRPSDDDDEVAADVGSSTSVLGCPVEAPAELGATSPPGTSHADGESVEAIEAAVASLTLQKQLLLQQQSLRQGDASTQQQAIAVTDADVGTSEEVLPSQEAAASANTAAGEIASTSAPSNTDDESTQWHTYPKHFFILSSAGKPIYSYNGDEKSLVGLTALISALISVVQSQGDAVQHIRSGSTLIVFKLHGPLYFVAASSLGEPATALRKQLELLYGQLVLIVTTGLERIIQRNPAYDVRSLLDGVGGVLTSLISLLAADASYLLGAYKPLPVPAADRAAVSELLSDAVRQSGAVYGLLMADTYLVALSRAKQQPQLHPDDLLLLANFVMCNNAYRHGHGEAFSPVCLPHFNSDAFLHAYIHYLDASSGLYLVLLSGSAEAFHQLAAGRRWLEEQATARGLMPRLRALRPPEHPGGAAGAAAAAAGAAAAGGTDGSSAGGCGAGRMQPQLPQHQQQQQLNVLSVENLPRPLGGKFGHTPLWSYAVRFNALQQAIFSPPGPRHRDPAGAARLAATYAQLHSLLHSPAAAAPGAPPGSARPNKLAWFADSSSVLVASRDRDTEVYLVCDPLTDKATAMGLLEAMRRHFGDRGIAADVTLATPA